MIPGDIDLTQNLDFRKTVRRELPQFPANWNKDEKKDSSKRSYLNTSTSSLSSYLSSSVSNYIRIDNNVSLTVYNTYYDSLRDINLYDVDIDIMYDRVNEYIANSTYYDDDFEILENYSGYTINFNYTNGGHYGYITPTSTRGRFLSTHKDTKKDEYDVFGNKKRKKQSYIPSIPWSTTKRTERIESIPWKTHEARKSYYGYFDGSQRCVDKPIPWKKVSKLNNNKDLVTPSTRAQCLISWLKDKSLSFIRNYLDKESEDNSSYLTNMSWIRVRDAVID